MRPNFLIIGAEKSGTTWLYNILKQHPEIYLPLTKECHFFNRYDSNLIEVDNYNKLGWEWYKKFFSDVPEQNRARGEVTPMYLCDPVAPERIAKCLPNVKLIYILRNPIERAYSHYWMAFRKGHVRKSFEEVVAEKDPRIVERGRYGAQLRKYYDLFSNDQICGFTFESFFANPRIGLNEILSFLNVEEVSLPLKISEKESNFASKPKIKILSNTISKLTTTLRKNTFTFDFLDWLKKKGITDKIKKWNSVSVSYPPIKKAIYFELFDYYKKDMEILSDEFDINIDIWKNYKEQ